MAIPTVGDAVWFYPGGTDELAHFGSACAAIVVRSFDDGSVNMVVFDPDGVVWSRLAVHPRKDADGAAKEGFFEVRSSFGGKPKDPAAAKKK